MRRWRRRCSDGCAARCEALRVGQAEDFATDVPPVIEREAQRRVLEAIATGALEGRIGRAAIR